VALPVQPAQTDLFVPLPGAQFDPYTVPEAALG
jgi:hypothetical protein